MRAAVLALALFVMAAACSSKDRQAAQRDKPEQSEVDSRQQNSQRAQRITSFAERFECHRCHEGLASAPPPAKQCVGCHQKISDGTFEASTETLQRWQSNLKSLPAAPPLQAAGHKLRRSFVVSQLLRPEDQRPELLATMPRLAITDSEARAFAADLIPEEREAVFSPELVSEGARLFAELNCRACHRFGAKGLVEGGPLPTGSEAGLRTRALAPDLAKTRERFQSGRLVAWLRDPQSVQPQTLMPSFRLSAAQAESLAAFLWLSEVEAPAAVSIPARLPLLNRPVSFEEVDKAIFKKVCWHCHASEDFAYGDGGPGNTGGFGYPPRGLDMSGYAALRSGSLDDKGERRSIFVVGEDGESILLRRLLLRQREEAGDLTDEVGMPLGLPSLPPEDIQLLETWIAQGRPR